MALISIGCADTDSNPSGVNASQAKQTVEADPSMAGEAIKTKINPSSGEATETATGKRCVTGHEKETELGNVSARAFYTYRKEDSSRRVKANLDIDVSAGIGATVKSKVKQTYDISNTRRKLFVVARVEARKLEWIRGTPTDDDGQTAECKGFQPYSDIDAFIDACGQRYVDDLLYGGYVILSMDQTNMSREERIAIESEVGASGGAFGVNMSQLFQKMNSSSKITSNFTTRIVGAGMPSVPAEFTDGITAQEWEDFVQELVEVETGSILDYSVAPYLVSDYDACGVEPLPEEDPKSCYQDFAADVEEYVRTDSEVNQQAERVRKMLDDKQQVDWGKNPQDTQKAYENWLRQFEACTAPLRSGDGLQIEEKFQQCETEYKDGNFGDICDLCSMPEQCRTENLLGELGSLPPAYVRVPDTLETSEPGNNPSYSEPDRTSYGNGFSKNVAGTADEICVLTRVSGGFRGAGEKVALTYEQNGTDEDGNPIMNWMINVNSQRTDQEHHLGATVHCVDRDNFFGTNGTADWFAPKDYSVTSRSGAKEFTPVPNGIEINAISGISGKMAGRAEDATFKDNGNLSTGRGLRVKSNQGWIKAWSTSFGLKNPLNKEGGATVPRLNRAKQINSPTNRSKSLIPYHEGICYLTHVGGELDGGGERVEIYKSGDHWNLRVKGVCQTDRMWGCVNWKEVEGQARCIYYNQNDI